MAYGFTKKIALIVGPTGDPGYVTDGTADDVQINAAITALNTAGGGTVQLQAGVTYDINASVNLASNVNLIGRGWSTVIKSKNALNSFPIKASFVTTAVNNIILKDFKVDLNGPNQTSNGWVALTGITNFTIDHVYIYNAYLFGILIQPAGDAITGDQAKYGLVQNCRFDTGMSNSPDFAILNIQHSRIVNNFWGQCRASQSPNYALSAGRSMRNTIIANNTFENTNQSSIGIEDIEDVIVTGNRITGTTLPGSNGIFMPVFQAGFNPKRCVISDNIVSGMGNDGINLGSMQDAVISGNICHSNGRDGIAINTSMRNTVSNNVCFNNNQLANVTPTGTGIRFSGGTPMNNVLIGNQCYDSQITPTQFYGIYSGNGDNFTIIGNRFSGNITAALSVTGSANLIHSNMGYTGGTALPLVNGGTGATTQSGAANAVLPSQTGNSGKYLTSNGTSVSWASVGSSMTLANKTANYTFSSSDDVITADASAGAFTLTFPTAVGIAGRIYRAKKTDSSANAVTIATTSSQTIDGVTTFLLLDQNDTISAISNGANWLII